MRSGKDFFMKKLFGNIVDWTAAVMVVALAMVGHVPAQSL